jgi:dissimilatory sulfite reductase related protein
MSDERHLESDFDDDGLLKDPSAWTRALAERIAQAEGLGGLTEAHWKIIDALREYHAKYRVAPPIPQVCRDLGMPKNAAHDLFHTCMTAWRVAGLPNPGEEAKSYLSDM